MADGRGQPSKVGSNTALRLGWQVHVEGSSHALCNFVGDFKCSRAETPDMASQGQETVRGILRGQRIRHPLRGPVPVIIQEGQHRIDHWQGYPSRPVPRPPPSRTFEYLGFTLWYRVPRRASSASVTAGVSRPASAQIAAFLHKRVWVVETGQQPINRSGRILPGHRPDRRLPHVLVLLLRGSPAGRRSSAPAFRPASAWTAASRTYESG